MAAARTPRTRKPTPGEPKLAPVANDNDGALERPLAPWPQLDRWPVVLGSALTIKYIASVWRLCQQGYRQQFVDVLDELLDRDPGTYAVLSARVLAAATGRVELTPATTAPGSPDEERALAIRDMVQARLDAIPRFTQARAELLWGIYPGLSAQEILWDRRADGWWVNGLNFIHSRRIAYPNWNVLTAYIWDQGAVQPWNYGVAPTQGAYGLCIADHPGKFIFHEAQIRGDYPTRGGLGRIIGWYMAMKIMAVRGAGDYVERFAKPWVWATFNTGTPETQGKPRVASAQDIAQADEAVRALGIGSLNAATFSDAITLNLEGPGFKGSSGSIDHAKLVQLCDNQISRAVSAGTLSTDGAEVGARGLGEVHERGAIKNAAYDAASLDETLQRDLIHWIVRLNCPGEEHLAPTITTHVEKLDANALLKRVSEFAAMGGRPDAAWVSKQIGIPEADAKNPDARALAPLKPTDYFALLGAEASTLPEALEGLAARVGVSLTPTQKSALARLQPDVAAQFVADLLAQAAATNKGASPTTTPAVPNDAPVDPAGTVGASSDTTPPADAPETTDDISTPEE